MPKGTIKIRTPIWKTRSVGIADFRLGGDVIRVEILYKNRNKIRIYPSIYEMKTERVCRYPTQNVKGVTLHIVPIGDFRKVKKDRDGG